MEEQVNQEVVAQPSGQTEQVSPEAVVVEAAQPEPQVAEVQEQAQETKPEPVLTEQKVLELVSKAAKEAAAETLREIQSRTDKAEARIKKEVQEQIERLKGIGVELTPEQQNHLAAQTRQKFAQVEAPPPANPIDAMRDELEKEYGIELSGDDLEAKLVVVNESPTKFLRTYEKALQAKKDRLNPSQAKSTPKEEKSEPSKARMVTSPNKGAIGLTISDPDELFNQAYSKK
jgi:hypothetical protein